MKAINRNSLITASYLSLLTALLSSGIRAGIPHRRGVKPNTGAAQSGAIIIHSLQD